MKKGISSIFLFLVFFNFLNLSEPKKIKLLKKDIETIKKGLFIDSYMLSQNEFFYKQNHSSKNEKEENGKRNLNEDEIILENVGFFSYDLSYATRSIWSFNNLFGNINKDTTKYIIYPYAFTYKTKNDNDEIIEKEKDKGGFFSLNPSILPTESYPHYFENLKDITSVKVSKSKALYDIDVGILTYETTYEGSSTNILRS